MVGSPPVRANEIFQLRESSGLKVPRFLPCQRYPLLPCYQRGTSRLKNYQTLQALPDTTSIVSTKTDP